jgi:hypothetical protein
MRLAMCSALMLASVSLAGCHTMKPVSLEEVGAVRPAQVRVTRTDQSVVVVYGPQVLNNRLVGFVDGTYRVMPAADVKQVLVRQPAGGRTAALIAAGALGVTALVYTLSSTGTYRDPCRLGSSECEPM